MTKRRTKKEKKIIIKMQKSWIMDSKHTLIANSKKKKSLMRAKNNLWWLERSTSFAKRFARVAKHIIIKQTCRG